MTSIDAIDEFAYHTPASKAGILVMQGMAPDRLLALARSDGFALARGEGDADALGAFADVVAATGPGTNPTWVTHGAAEEAYGRDLMAPEEMDWITR